MENDKENLNPPEQTNKDFKYSLSKGIVSMIPAVGGALSTTIFEDIINSPIEKRLHEWRLLVQKAIYGLRDKHDEYKTENLRNNPEFVSLFLELQPIAIKNHQEEKLEFLRNFLLQSVIDDSNYNSNKRLLRIIDELPPNDVLVLYQLELFKHLIQTSRKKKYKKHVKSRKLIDDKHKYEYREIACSDEFVDYLIDDKIIADSYYGDCWQSLDNLQNYELIKKEFFPIELRKRSEKDFYAMESDFIKVMCIQTTNLGLMLLGKVVMNFPKCLKEIK